MRPEMIAQNLPPDMTKIDNHPNGIASPRPNESVYDQCISIAGSIRAERNALGTRWIRAWIDNTCIGQTEICTSENPDHQLCYRILARLSEPIEVPRSAVINVTFSVDGGKGESVGKVPVQLVPADLAERPYGQVLPPDQAKVLHRENIYGCGPPSEQASPAVLEILLGYLSPRSSVVDVGCGAGAFAAALMTADHKWLGLEVNDHCIELLAARRLPYRRLERATLQLFPCVDGEFDDAVCIEVLEHVDIPDAFLKEIGRVIRGRALFSVPNMEVIPYFSSSGVVPWHLLEATHKNFFTRLSLRRLLEEHFKRVEVFSYGEHPLYTRDNIPLHLHLFAVAAK